MKTFHYHSNFTAGELSPRIAGYVDFEKYQNGVALMENWLPLQQGGIIRRSGFYYAGTAKLSTKKSRLVPFVFNSGQTYMLEFGDYYLRFYQNHGLILSGGVPYEITTPYSAAQAFELDWTQTADVLYLTHPDIIQQQLTRSGTTAWTINNHVLKDGPYLPLNTGPITLVSDVALGTVTLTASAALFVATDVGRLVRINNGTTWEWGTLTAFTSSTVMTCQTSTAAGFPTVATVNWQLGAFSATTGYPYNVTLMQQRLIYAGNDHNPQGRWMSRVGQYADFSPTEPDGTVTDTNAITITLAGNQINGSRWMLPKRQQLWSATAGSLWTLDAAGIAEPTKNTLTANSENASGSQRYARPVNYAHMALYVQTGGRKILSAGYDWRIQGIRATDLTLLADHITKPSITDLSYSAQPNKTVWALRTDGVLISITYNDLQNEVACARQTTDGMIESIAVIPNGGEDELWISVQRTVNGVVQRFIEYASPLHFNDLPDNWLFLDSQLQYKGPPTTTITGLDHWEGEAIDVLADKDYLGKLTVSGGSITLTKAASNVVAGKLYTSSFTTLPILTSPQTIGTKQKIGKLYLKLLNAFGVRVDGELIDFRGISGLNLAPTVTGDYRWTPSGGYDNESNFTLSVDRPFPATILGFGAHIDVS